MFGCVWYVCFFFPGGPTTVVPLTSGGPGSIQKKKHTRNEKIDFQHHMPDDFFFHKQLGVETLNFEEFALLFLLFFTLLHLILPLIGSLRLLNPCLHKRSTKAYPPTEFTNMTDCWKSPHFPIGNTSTHFGSTFQPAMLVFRTLQFFCKVPCKGTFANGDFI